jgi:hypothetical protein
MAGAGSRSRIQGIGSGVLSERLFAIGFSEQGSAFRIFFQDLPLGIWNNRNNHHDDTF